MSSIIKTTAALLVAAVITSAVQAQTLSIDPPASLAWWQLNPHMGHLWATTCPQDPSWQAGESRSVEGDRTKRKQVSIVSDDEIRIPLYPRDSVQSICAQAVTGTITFADSTRWTGVRGTVRVRTQNLFGGMEMRDDFARRAIYDTDKYPEIQFHIDSLTNVRRGDTLRADAVGAFEFRGVKTAMSVPIEAWKEPEGMRVKGMFAVPASHLTSVYGVSQFALGLGLATRIWKTLHMGFDLVLVPGPGRNT